MRDLEDRAYGAMIGLCIGNAVGLPALFHRAARSGWRRRILWEFSAQLDEQNVNKFMLPFTLGPPDELTLCGTDDSEFAAVAAEMLLHSGPEMEHRHAFRPVASPCGGRGGRGVGRHR